MGRRYSDAQALALIEPELSRFGITRVAEQTRLDRTGIPCFAAIRPNAMSLAVNQGKGIDDQSARLSAIMEAIEFSTAEAPLAARTVASIEQLEEAGRSVFLPNNLLPRGYMLGRKDDLTWLRGHGLSDGRQMCVPLDSVALVPNSLEKQPFSQSSNGLGAGFSLQEATVHGWCELIERDASTLWSLRSSRRCAETEIDVEEVAEPLARKCIGQIRDAGFELKLFDLTTDLGVPVVMALLWEGDPRLHFDVASGVCAHPEAGKAIAGAVLEAAQTRVSNIAGARDDIEPTDYDKPIPDWIGRIVSSRPSVLRPTPPSLDDAGFASLSWTIGRDAIVTPLSLPHDGISVVKVVCGTLEDRQTNAHWRPGRRAMRAMTEL